VSGAATKITLACIDLAGTTVADDDTVETAFGEAIATLGVVSGTGAYERAMARIRESRGRPKIDVFREVFPGDEARARVAELAFERSYDSVIDRTGLRPIPGAEHAIDKLVGSGVRVCLVTGFSRSTQGRIIDTLGWWRRIDLALCPADVPRGRPWPDLVLHAALRLGIDDVRHIAVCGDTDSDMRCGRRAGASVVAGVRTGAHDSDRLRDAGATHVIDSVADLPELILGDAAPVDLVAPACAAAPPADLEVPGLGRN
jgi:phosphoglycolate phosphatase